MYQPGTFMGARVRSFSGSIGWGSSGSSQMSVSLVDDPVTGAILNPLPHGSPVYLEYYGLRFSGLLQRLETRLGIDGNPVYEASIMDPREILDGAQVITGAYAGPVSLPNIVNAYGFHESKGFGSSLINESGMPWSLVQSAILTTVNGGGGSFGGPLIFLGQRYGLDLSELPILPGYYRVGSGSYIGLLELIAQVCLDGGMDFFVDLIGYTIKIRTVSRINTMPLGTISSLANSNYANALMKSNAGVEVRNEVTSSFVMGGEVTTMLMTTGARTFWGYSPTGSPIVGVPGTYKIGNDTYEVERMTLNAMSVSDIIGSITYQTTDLELRCAMTNMETWKAFVIKHNELYAEIAGLTSLFREGINVNNAAPNRGNFINDDAKNIVEVAKNAVAGDLYARELRLYEFVRSHAEEYMGKKFLVPLPFILSKIDPETLQATTSWEVTDGGYLPEDSTPLGLSLLNQDIFKHNDGRFKAFVAYDNLIGADLSKISGGSTVIEGGVAYTECQVDPRILFLPQPYVLVTLSSMMTDMALDAVGDLKFAAGLLGLVENAAKILMQAVVPIKIAPAARYPSLFAIPLKSNTLTYGPWYAAGAAGKVRVEYDPSLTPWNYGGYAAMDFAGKARVTTSITNLQLYETGSLELVGPPGFSLGDILESGGPNVTGISVNISPQGVSTNYNFATFTPRFGVISRQATERIRKISQSVQELKRSFRASIRESIVLSNAITNAVRTRRAFQEYLGKANKRETPLDALISYTSWDKNIKGYRNTISMTTAEEALVMSNANNTEDWKATTIMSLDGLVRPFVSAKWSEREQNYSTYAATGVPICITENASLNVQKDEMPTAMMLDPWKSANDQMYLSMAASGDYFGINQINRSTGPETWASRRFGLRGPLMVVGWGYGLDGSYVPGSSLPKWADSKADWDSDVLKNQSKWKVGPVDLLWDKDRNVWTPHGTAKVRLTEGILPGGSGKATVWSDNLLPTQTEIYVHNNSNCPIFADDIYGLSSSSFSISGVKPHSGLSSAIYSPQTNKWYLARTPSLDGSTISGRAKTEFAAYGKIRVYDQVAEKSFDMEVKNIFSSAVASGAKVLATWCANEYSYVIVAADCS